MEDFTTRLMMQPIRSENINDMNADIQSDGNIGFDTVNSDPAAPLDEGRSRFRLCSIPIALILCGAFYYQSRSETLTDSPYANAQVSVREFTVQSHTEKSEVTIAAIIGPSQLTPVIAPFDGTVTKLSFQYGDRVKAGDILAVLDMTQIRAEGRTARATYMKALMQFQEMESWDSSPEMQRARRAVQAENARLKDLETQIVELRKLLSSGIIARSELQNVEQQRDAQLLVIEGAKSELQSLEMKAGSQQQQIARLELDNAREKFESTERQLREATVIAPVSGIMVRPPKPSSGSDLAPVEVGAMARSATAMFAIANTEQLVASGYVDEADVAGLRVGQAATVQISSASNAVFEGNVISVSSEARLDSSSMQRATYAIRALFSNGASPVHHTLRLGMSAQLTITVNERINTIVIPIEAVRHVGDEYFVVRRKLNSASEQNVPVKLGPTNERGVIITNGLTEGDILIY